MRHGPLRGDYGGRRRADHLPGIVDAHGVGAPVAEASQVGDARRCPEEGRPGGAEGADHLARIVDPAGRTGLAWREVGYRAVVPANGVARRGRGRGGATDDLAEGVDGRGPAGIPSEGAQVGHHAVLPEERVGARGPDHLPGIIDVGGLSALNPAEGPEVRHHVGARRRGGSRAFLGERRKEDECESRDSGDRHARRSSRGPAMG